MDVANIAICGAAASVRRTGIPVANAGGDSGGVLSVRDGPTRYPLTNP
jgi:hypothetical protein